MQPRDVPGRISEYTGETLRRFARYVPADQLIVEIGAFQGKSTCYLATGSLEGNGARIISIDTWGMEGSNPGPKKIGPIYHEPGNQDRAYTNVEACGGAHLLTQIRAFSSSAVIPDTPIGLLWVDGAHDYHSVTADFERYVPAMAEGATLVVDDYGTGKCRDVDQAVKELITDPYTWIAWSFRSPLAIGTKA